MKTKKNRFYSQDDIGIQRLNAMNTNRILRSEDQIKLEEYIKESHTKYENENSKMHKITDSNQLINGNLYAIEFKENDDIEYFGKKCIGLFHKILRGRLMFKAIYCFQKDPMITIKETPLTPIEANKYTIYKLSDTRFLVNQADNLVNQARKAMMNQILSQLIPYNKEYMDMYPDRKENILDKLSYRFFDTQRYTSKSKGGYSKRNRRNKSKKNKSNKNHKLKIESNNV